MALDIHVVADPYWASPEYSTLVFPEVLMQSGGRWNLCPLESRIENDKRAKRINVVVTPKITCNRALSPLSTCCLNVLFMAEPAEIYIQDDTETIFPEGRRFLPVELTITAFRTKQRQRVTETAILRQALFTAYIGLVCQTGSHDNSFPVFLF